jgi:hypothetical protein
MTRCKRCGSFKAVGRVYFQSPERVKTLYTQWKLRGIERYFPLCMSCIIKLEQWIEGKDVRESGQAMIDW